MLDNMKKIISIAVLLLMMPVAQAQVNYCIKGDLGRPDFTGTVYLRNILNHESSAAVDSFTVVKGVICEHEATADSIFWGHLYDKSYKFQVLLFVEDGTITASKFEDDKVLFTGTPLNDEYFNLHHQLYQLSKSFANGSMSEKDAFTQLDSLVFPVLQRHTDDPLGYAMVNEFYDQTYSGERGIEYIDMLSDRWRNNRIVKSLRELLVKQQTTQPGAMFKDFAVEHDGKTTRLSDYVGRGQYVVADFWASWCGPCRREIPNLISLYNKYRDKGLVVLGIAVWDKPEATLKAIEEEHIPYPQIINSQSIATDLYGINGVPEVILFAPDGTIIDRGRRLRGENLELQVRKALMLE